MATLYVKDVPDDTKATVAKLAEEQGTSLSEYVRRILDDIAEKERKRLVRREVRGRLKTMHKDAGDKRSSMEAAVAAVRAVRDDYEHGTAR